MPVSRQTVALLCMGPSMIFSPLEQGLRKESVLADGLWGNKRGSEEHADNEERTVKGRAIIAGPVEDGSVWMGELVRWLSTPTKVLTNGILEA